MVYCAGKLTENGSRFTSHSRVLPTSQVGYHACKPIESVVYCVNISVMINNPPLYSGKGRFPFLWYVQLKHLKLAKMASK